MKNLASQALFCILVPGLSVFFKVRTNTGNWLGVSILQPDVIGITELV